MISAGYFEVPPSIVNWDKERAKRFLKEMFNHGGRISWHEYRYWLSLIEKKQGRR